LNLGKRRPNPRSSTQRRMKDKGTVIKEQALESPTVSDIGFGAQTCKTKNSLIILRKIILNISPVFVSIRLRDYTFNFFFKS
jgi:hypothetical protein